MVQSPFLHERSRCRMENKIFKKLFPGVDEKYLERAFEKLKKDGCPEGKDLLVDVWGHFSALQVGFGLSFVLPVVTALLKAKTGDLILIENPEAHLHPSAQVRLGQMISKAVSCGAQVIVETHSDHLLNGIRLARKEKVLKLESDVNLIFVQRKSINNELVTLTNEIKIYDNGKLSDRPPFFFDTWEDTLMKLI